MNILKIILICLVLILVYFVINYKLDNNGNNPISLILKIVGQKQKQKNKKQIKKVQKISLENAFNRIKMKYGKGEKKLDGTYNIYNYKPSTITKSISDERNIRLFFSFILFSPFLLLSPILICDLIKC